MLKKWLPNDKATGSPPRAAAPNVENDKFWSIVEQIDGLDVSIGVSRVGGQRAVYKKMLELMVQEIEKSNKNLAEFLSANDMNSFRIEVHGMKSSLANVGSMELSGKALELEIASRNEDAGLCAANLPALLEGLSNLQLKLKEAFEAVK
ncbi:MAG: Hpt domain-containing protein [Syntrophorhabdaceae bacterium]|nr:Hpt domain-containing protein [Syntrophorhabdaceae bacterium]